MQVPGRVEIDQETSPVRPFAGRLRECDQAMPATVAKCAAGNEAPAGEVGQDHLDDPAEHDENRTPHDEVLGTAPRRRGRHALPTTATTSGDDAGLPAVTSPAVMGEGLKPLTIR